MDVEKLIRRLRNDADAYRNGETLGRAFADQEDVLDNAATALSTLQAENNGLKEKLYDGEGVNLVDYWMQQAKIEENGHRNCQAENEKLRSEVERQRRSADDRKHLYENAERAYMKVVAELERVTAERDAAKSTLAERIGVRGAEPITTAFGLPIDRLRELAKADRDGRCVVLPEGGCEDKDGENALKSAMNTCFYHNNPVTRFIADAVAEKLTRQEAQAALRREQE